MRTLEKFIFFVEQRSAAQSQSVEANLAALMESYSEEYAFTEAEISELDRRMAEPNPELAAPEDIAKLFGKPFSA
ncbi:MAG: hypothetical protein AAGH53_06950 [Pseudomonadota bacterium]